MSDEQGPRTTFTFRVACDDIKRVGTQLSTLTTQVKAVGDSINSAQIDIDNKRKELRVLTKRVASKLGTLEKLKKRAEKTRQKASARSSAINTVSDGTPQSVEDINTTFATEDMSIVVSINSPSPLKRKRFAGIWDGVELDIPGQHTEKRARLESCALDGHEHKENVVPEAGPSRI